MLKGKFKQPGAMAVLIGNNGQRYILSNKGKSSASQSELVYIVKNVLLPMKNIGALTTRGGEEKGIVDLEMALGDTTFLIIGDDLKLKLDKNLYPMNENYFFIYSYDYNGKSINKKLSFSQDTLIFKKSRLYQKSGQIIDPNQIEEVKVYYFDKTKGRSRLINKINPIFIKSDLLKQEVQVIVDVYQENRVNKVKIKEEVYFYLNSYYRNYSKDQIEVWLKSNFSL